MSPYALTRLASLATLSPQERGRKPKLRRPVFSDAGASSFLFPSSLIPRERSAVRRTIKSIRTAAVEACEACRHGRRAGRTLLRARTVTHAPNGAPLAAILGLGTVLPGAGHTRPRRLSLLLPHLVQPSKAAPPKLERTAPLGLPEHGCEPRRRRRTSRDGRTRAGPVKLLRQQNASRWRPRMSKAGTAYLN